MPDSFVITTPATTIKLGPDRRGEIAVTVTNITGRELRARLLLVPTEPAKAEWFAIAGDSERPYGLGATQSYTVQIHVPDSVEGATFTFRGDAAAEDQPEEDFAHGPTVAMTVAPKAKKKPFPWWIVIAAAVIVVAGIIIGVVASGSKKKTTTTATVPNVVGLHTSAGIGALRNAGFTPSPTTPQFCDPAITSQNPPGNTTAKKGSTVVLTVVGCRLVPLTPTTTAAAGPVTVPNLLDNSGTAAMLSAKVTNAGLTPIFQVIQGVPFTPSDNATYTVHAQSPPAGTTLNRGDNVVLTVTVNAAHF